MFWNRLAFLLFAFVFALVLLFTLLTPAASAQTRTSVPSTQGSSTTSPQPFDVKAAVDAYLAKVPALQRARSDAYFEGGYWLLLWDSCPPFW